MKNAFGGRERIRTAVQGFADLCLTTRPRDPFIKQDCKYTGFFKRMQHLL